MTFTHHRCTTIACDICGEAITNYEDETVIHFPDDEVEATRLAIEWESVLPFDDDKVGCSMCFQDIVAYLSQPPRTPR